MIHLHTHTKYSLLDGMMHIEDIAERLKEIGQDTIAITEHGNLYSNVEAFSKLSKEGIKVINGCEVYICDDVNVTNKDSKYYHLILLCKNEQGRLNLNWLVSQSTLHKYYGRPRIDFKMLKGHHEGLICLSACMAGEVSRALENNDNQLAESIALKYKNLFGEDYYIEYQAHLVDEQQRLNLQLINLANKLGIKYVVTCDAHYVRPEDEKYHNIFIQIGSQREAGEIYKDCYLQSEQDVIDKCVSTKQYTQQAIATTHEIANKCENTIPLSAPIIPHFTVPAPYKSELEYLKFLCNDGLKKKGFMNWNMEQWNQYMTDRVYAEDGTYVEVKLVQFNSVKEIQQIYIKRAKYEMNALEAMGFEGYYLMVHSYVNAAKRRGIARGSGGGSLLAYLCGIVDIDPIKYGLYFERFIDVGAIDLLKDGTITKKELKIPDFDVDFSPNDREKVVQYVINKYGEDNVVSLGQFQYLWAKGAIKDIGRVLGIPFEITNEITKNLDGETIEEALASGVLDNYKDEYPQLFEYASKLSGLPKSFGVHPCFPKDSLVLTDNGYKQIQDITTSDKVWTHNSRYQPVISTSVSNTNQLVTVNMRGTLPIRCTPNHQFYVRHRIKQRPREYSNAVWVEAKDIKKTDMVALPINNNNHIIEFNSIPTQNSYFWWIIGRYVGDGWLKKRYDYRNDRVITICCNKSETAEITNVLDKLQTYNYWIDNERTVNRINIANKYLYEFLTKFGSGANGKFIPNFVMDLPVDLLSSFIDGYLSADGYIDKQGANNFKTVSKLLAFGMMQCIAKVYKQSCSITVIPAHKDIIEGRLVNAKEKYTVSFYKHKTKKNSNFIEDNILWLFVRGITIEQNDCCVYNLSVLDDNTYTINNIAVHNCGKCITIKKADYYNAIEWNDGNKTWVLEGDMHSADDLGLVKADFLGLRTLDVIYDTLEMIGKDYDYIAPHKLNMNDPKVWNEFAQGNTDCIFQFESPGMKQMLKDMQCNRMDELSAANALYRPGSKQYIPNYVNRKNGLETIEYLHPDLEPILKNSYGIIVFQEQLIEIGRLAGLRNPDELRKATAKKKPKLMAKIEPELKNGLMKRGWTDVQVKQLWDTILQFAKYSFNKSHSSAYGLTAYITMFLKVYHTNEFFTACINSYDGDIKNIVKTIKEAKRMGVDIKFDKWQNATGETVCHDNSVWLGTNTMKGFGKNVAIALNELAKNDYNDFIEFLIDASTNPNIDKSQLESLIKLNWFKSFGTNGKLLRIYNLYNDIYGRKQFMKDKCSIPHDIITQFCKETEKQYREVNSSALLSHMCSVIADSELPLEYVLKTQSEVYGYISYIDPSRQNTAVTMDINTKYNTFKVQLYRIDTGTTITYKLKKKYFENNPLPVGSIIKFSTEIEHGWRKDENDQWQADYSKQDTWLTSYIIESYN